MTSFRVPSTIPSALIVTLAPPVEDLSSTVRRSEDDIDSYEYVPSDCFTGLLKPSVDAVILATPPAMIVTAPVLGSTDATSGLSEENVTVFTLAFSGNTVAESVKDSSPM